MTNPVLLLHFNGYNESEETIDNSFYHRIITSHNSAKITTANKKFGSASFKQGVSADYWSFSDSSELHLAGNDFTFETWINFDTLPTNPNDYNLILKQFQDVDNRNVIQLSVNADLDIFIGVMSLIDGNYILSEWQYLPLLEDTWHNISITRKGSIIRFFIDGIKAQEVDVGTDDFADISSDWTIGEIGGTHVGNYYLDEFRLTVGECLYEADYTPATAEFEDAATALGKSYFKVKINEVDITESLNVNIDSIRWMETVNASWEADFSLALPYDSVLKPTKGHSVDIYFNNELKFHGYITSISSSSNEQISIRCEDEYHILNRNTVDFSVGHGETYSTYKLALAALSFPEDIGNFTPEDETYNELGEADAISQIVSKCGTFGWYIQPDGTYKLQTLGAGDIITLNRQTIGSNLGLRDVISHSIAEDDTDKIDKIKVIMGDDVHKGHDNEWWGAGLRTAFRPKYPDDPTIYAENYISEAGWFDIDGGGKVYYTNTQVADENICEVYQLAEYGHEGEVVEETTNAYTFEIGTGTIYKNLSLSGLNRQYGVTYLDWTQVSSSWGEQKTLLPSQSQTYDPVVLTPPTVVIPTWDDTAYATDIANVEYYKYKDTKISAQIQVTFDCIEYYGIDLTKRITIAGICTALNIKSISYDVGSYLVTINLESENYYKRSVSIPAHE